MRITRRFGKSIRSSISAKSPRWRARRRSAPIRDFGFDAAILFSDLLFPLEAMGMGLRYEEGPKLDWHLRDLKDLTRLAGGVTLARDLSFQAEAMKLIRAALPAEKGLLGFVGGPLTLFCYAVEGSHSGFARFGTHGTHRWPLRRFLRPLTRYAGREYGDAGTRGCRYRGGARHLRGRTRSRDLRSIRRSRARRTLLPVRAPLPVFADRLLFERHRTRTLAALTAITGRGTWASTGTTISRRCSKRTETFGRSRAMWIRSGSSWNRRNWRRACVKFSSGCSRSLAKSVGVGFAVSVTAYCPKTPEANVRLFLPRAAGNVFRSK